MSTAKELLSMIEAVDPGDTAKLDEIDWLVVCWAYKGLGLHKDADGNCYSKDGIKVDLGYSAYTRSRDSLKNLRPQGWVFNVGFTGLGDGGEYTYSAHSIGMKKPMGSGAEVLADRYPTEELAELAAIIQAIAYERGEG